MTLGQKIKKLRMKKGLTQKDLADQTHVTFQTISKWENDENEPDVSTLRELAKLFECSMDVLLGEDETIETKEKTPDSHSGEDKEPVIQQIIIHQKELHVCSKCGEDIPENDLYVEHLTRKKRHGRLSVTVPAGEAYYHKKCWAAVESERKEAKRKAISDRSSKNRKISLGWGIFAGITVLVIALLVLLTNKEFKETIHPALAVLYSILFGYGAFSMIYCILCGSYIGEVFVWCASRSIKFPMIIFSWDLDGFAFLIAMKILFAILGFLFGLFTLLFAIVFSSALSGISFPFILIHNIRTDYEDGLFD